MHSILAAFILPAISVRSSCLRNPIEVLGSRPDLAQAHGLQLTYEPDDSEIPAEWDWRNVSGKSYVTRNLNQHIPKYCGSCWAHAAISSFSDRLKIMRNAAWPDIELSVQYTLNCMNKAGTCMGGSDLLLYEQMRRRGVPDETCEVYVAEDQKCTPTNQCRNCFGPPGQGVCFPQPRYKLYKAKDFGYFSGDSKALPMNKVLGIRTLNREEMIRKMKQEIHRNGPISCVVDADTMFNYTEGEILDVQGTEVNHVISIAGWGVDTDRNLTYWIGRNSWGTYWGENGWINIKQGSNSALVESMCAWVAPTWPPEEVDRDKDGNGTLEDILDDVEDVIKIRSLSNESGTEKINDIFEGEVIEVLG